MQKLSRDRLIQAEFAAFSESDHAPNRLTPVFPIKAAILRQTRKRRVEHLFHRAVETACQLLLNDSFQLWFELDSHNFNVSSSIASCKRE